MPTITNHTLPSLFRHYRMLLHLNRSLSTMLPAHLGSHCYVANFRANTLVIHVDSALWARRLYHEKLTLLKQWQTLPSSPKINKIEIQVRPPILPIRPPNSSHKPPLSKQTATSLQEVASTISHPKLKEVLLRLATRVDRD